MIWERHHIRALADLFDSVRGFSAECSHDIYLVAMLLAISVSAMAIKGGM